MKIDIQFKNEDFSLSSSPSSFKELVRLIKDMFVSNLRESLEIQYQEGSKEWSQLDESRYKSMIEAPQQIDRIKLRIVEQIPDDSFSLILNSRVHENSELDIYQEKILERKFNYLYELNMFK